MTAPITPLDRNSPRGRELEDALTVALGDVEENVRRRAAERQQDAARTDAA